MKLFSMAFPWIWAIFKCNFGICWNRIKNLKKRFLEFWFVHFLFLFAKLWLFERSPSKNIANQRHAEFIWPRRLFLQKCLNILIKPLRKVCICLPSKSFGWQLINSKYWNWNNELVTIIIIIIKNAAICTMGNCLISSVQYWTINNVLWDILNNQIICWTFTLHYILNMLNMSKVKMSRAVSPLNWHMIYPWQEPLVETLDRWKIEPALSEISSSAFFISTFWKHPKNFL